MVIEQAKVCSIKEERPSDTSKIKRQLICLDHEEEVDTRSTADELRTDEDQSSQHTNTIKRDSNDVTNVRAAVDTIPTISEPMTDGDKRSQSAVADLVGSLRNVSLCFLWVCVG